MADLAGYEVVIREPVCIDYRRYGVCGMGPPSSGALGVGQIPGILESVDIGAGAPLDVEHDARELADELTARGHGVGIALNSGSRR